MYDDEFSYGIDNALQSLENVLTYTSYIHHSDPNARQEVEDAMLDIETCVADAKDRLEKLKAYLADI